MHLINKNTPPLFFLLSHTQKHQTWSRFGYQRNTLGVTSPTSWAKSSSSIRLKAANTLPHTTVTADTHSARRLAVEEKTWRIISVIKDKTSLTAKIDQASQINCCRQTFWLLLLSFSLLFHSHFFTTLCYFTSIHFVILSSSPFTSLLTVFLSLL